MRYAKCHPNRKHNSHGLCHACYQRKQYWAKREAGYPSWFAAGRTVQGWRDRYAAVSKWRKRNRSRSLAHARDHRRRLNRLYGGDPSRETLPRLKWLMAKAQKKKRPRHKRKATDAPLRKLSRRNGYPGDCLSLRKVRAGKAKGK